MSAGVRMKEMRSEKGGRVRRWEVGDARIMVHSVER